MNNKSRVPLQMLGQSGCKLQFPNCNIFLDPYLSNSVQDLDSPDLERLKPTPFLPESVTDADKVLITHEHIDHCDPHTIPKLAKASPQATFICPQTVYFKLIEWGIDEDRIILASEDWSELDENLSLRAIPAAHPDIVRDKNGNLACVGYLIKYYDQLIYLAGDTCVKQEIIDTLVASGPIHTAFLPVNEHNFFRGRRGIIGNMSVREAFQFAEEIKAKQVVAVHWDMFAINSVEPEEIKLIHKILNPSFTLSINPSQLNFNPVKVSFIIRTLNEGLHLGSLLQGIKEQKTDNLEYEIILIDSGSTDRTLEIAESYNCHILHITRDEFSFGRSLNMGCEAASGDVLVIISGHCVPVDQNWLQNLCQPILDDVAEYTYGRQIGASESQFSECQIFSKYYPEKDNQLEHDFFCNNANAAIKRIAWEEHYFDEDITGLEDMELAKRLISNKGRVCYVPKSTVIHYHAENWAQVKRRFEREAIALKKIMPQVHVSRFDTIRYIFSSVFNDWKCAWQENVWLDKARDIILYRWNQYFGAYKGNHEHRELSKKEKEKYFFPYQ
jgi:L-ascorbate metabolism protein UlaG (beta-lactamase superfamily)/glycosyltransferase involved in cell wall biosynthesis